MLFLVFEVGVALQVLVTEARDGTVCKGALEVSRGHLCDALGSQLHDSIGGVKIGNGGGHGIGVVGAAQLALVASHYPIASDIVDPIGEFLAVILDEQAGKAARGVGGALDIERTSWTSLYALAAMATA